MPQLEPHKVNGFITKHGKKIIAIQVFPEFEERLIKAARRKNLTRQSYIILATSKMLEEDEEKERMKSLEFL